MIKMRYFFILTIFCLLLLPCKVQAACCGSRFSYRAPSFFRNYVRTEITLQLTAAPEEATPAPTPTPTATPASTPKPTAAPASAQGPEAEMLRLVNQDRAVNGLSALVWDEALAQGARAHSQDMARNNYFSHTSPTYGGFADRLKAAGLTGMAGGENLAHYGSIEKAQAALMSSAGHRANLLNTAYRRIGIGIVEKNGAYYITQWFGR